MLTPLLWILTGLLSDGPLATHVRELDPVSGESKPVAGAELVLRELWPERSGRENRLPPRRTAARRSGDPFSNREVSDEQGIACFTSDFGFTTWAETSGNLYAFKPGYVPARVVLDSRASADVQLVRGLAARVELFVPKESAPTSVKDGWVHHAISGAGSNIGIGKYPVQLAWSADPSGGAHVALELFGFERETSTALLAFDGYDAIEIGPSRPASVHLRPRRSVELRVCDRESGEPIAGIHPVLRYGVLDERGFFQPCAKYDYDRYAARQEREEHLLSGPTDPVWLRSDQLLLPGEMAVQITNLPHREYQSSIYIDRRGEATRTPVTLLGPDAGDGVCTLYLERRLPPTK